MLVYAEPRRTKPHMLEQVVGYPRRQYYWNYRRSWLSEWQLFDRGGGNIVLGI